LFLIGDNKQSPMGQGHTTRKNCEYCLLALYGNLGRLDKGVPQAVFARQRRPGWDQAYSLEEASGPGKRRWRADSYPGAERFDDKAGKRATLSATQR